MKQVVIMPGGFHPFHAGHYALYKQAQEAFPGADVYVAATNDTSARPFPFAVKEKLAKLAGVAPGHFVQVKSPFQAREITANLDPENTELIFVRSEKDANKPPQAGGVKKDGNPAYLQPYDANRIEPMNRHAYMAYLPTVEFGPGMTSATEIRTAWPTLNEKRKTALVMSLYPKTQTNPKLAATVVKMLDMAIGSEVTEGIFGGLGGPASGPMLARGGPGYAGLSGAKKLRHDAYVELQMVDSLKHTNHNGRYDAEIKKKLLQAKEYLAKAKEIEQGLSEASFDKEAFRRHMADLEAREELRKTDPVSAKALDLRDKLPQQSKKKPEDDSIGINDPRHPGYAYTQAGQHKLDEFAPDEGGGARKFIPWPEFIEQVKQLTSKDFSCKENIVKSTIKARFVPHDPMEYGPTMLYSYYETRAGGRNKGAISTRGSIQVGKYTTGGLFGQNPDQLLTGFHLLKGHPFERHFDLTFDNIYKIANIIKGNKQGALEFKPEVAEGGFSDESQPIQNDTGVEVWGYAYNNRDQRVMWRKQFSSQQAAQQWANSKNATIMGMKSAPQDMSEDYVNEKK